MIDPTLKNANILIVDDQLANIDVLTGLLDAKGFTNYTTTTDSRKVVNLFEEFKPDLILLDLNMPHLNGFQVMIQLKTLIPADTYLPILVLTADVTQASKQKALAAGAKDFLTKPFDLVETDLRIRNLLLARYLTMQLKSQNQILEEKVKERTAELEKTNVELKMAKNRADEMNKLKSYFLSNISHEFRTPLISILGFSEILVNELENPEQIENARYIFESGQRLQKILNDILSLTDIEKQRLETSVKKIDLIQFIKSASTEYQKYAEKKGLIFKSILNQKEIWLNTDSTLLKNVIDNIFDNSIKFTKKGGISITVNLELEKESTKAVIKITDSGTGITPDKIQHIFTPFRQESEGLNRSHEGMGLGLSVAKQLVEILHGEIFIQSEIAKGTMLIIKLPVLHTEKELTEKIDLKKTTIIEPVMPAKSILHSILMVEDNPGNRSLFQIYLSNDFSVDKAADGITAIAMAEVKSYDVILMDISLGPGIDGIEAFQRIRQLPNYKNTPVIAVTAFAMKEDRQKFLDHGFTDYMQKPVLRGELISLIKNCIKKRTIKALV